ncbi:MAG TPA: hypothetical protein EYP16_02215, partial [Candidatus Atribacteria bacterium]|nr:hypothetical protein [Candidatus Atribacteria bacterium]
MKLKALVMAGGLGTRMKLKKEKPLIKIYNKTMLERVVEAIKNATKVDETIIVTSKHTPKTTKWARKLGLRVIEAPGKGFIHDYKYAIRKLQLKKTLIVSCDLPLVTRAHINYIIKYYEKCRKPALTVAVPLKLYEKMGLKEKYVIKVEDEDVIPIGINIIDGSLINEAEMDEEVLVIEDERLAINVNTINALKVTRKFLRQRMYWEKMSIKEACLKLCRQLEKAVRRNLTEAILLSGGVDTSILALIASKYVPLKAFTVAFKKGKPIDVKYATIVADFLDIEHHIYYFSEDELFRALPEVIKVLKTFDPMEVRNSVAIYIALRVVKEHGVNSVMTGDGSDELFAGYSYLLNLNLEELEFELRRMWSIMSFSSKILAKKLKLEVKLPYLDDKFKSFAMKLSSKYKVKVEG